MYAWANTAEDNLEQSGGPRWGIEIKMIEQESIKLKTQKCCKLQHLQPVNTHKLLVFLSQREGRKELLLILLALRQPPPLLPRRLLLLLLLLPLEATRANVYY